MILVTGASGTVGRAVVDAMKAKGTAFRAGFHDAGKADAARKAGVDSVVLDYEKPETLGPALAGVSTLYLLSSSVGPESNAVKAAKTAGVRRIVKQSVWGAAEKAFSFAKWHRAIEVEIEASGLEWTFLRPNGFMQNMVTFMGATIKSQGAFYQPAGDSRTSHVDVRDIAAVAAKVLTEPGHAGKAYDLSGPASLSYAEMAATLTAVLGREIRYVNITPEQYKQGAMAAGIPEAYADALVDLNRAYVDELGARVSPDVERLTGRLATSFETFARDNVAAWR